MMGAFIIPVLMTLLVLALIPKGNAIYVDMDGTLYKWNTNATVEDTHKPGFFENSTPDRKTVAATKLLVFLGFDVRILSAAYDETAIEEKKRALKKCGLSNIPAVFVKYGDRKGDYVDEKGSVLLDDYTKNLREWGGTPIKYYNGVNGTRGTYCGASVSYEMSPVKIAATIAKIANKT